MAQIPIARTPELSDANYDASSESEVSRSYYSPQTPFTPRVVSRSSSYGQTDDLKPLLSSSALQQTHSNGSSAHIVPRAIGASLTDPLHLPSTRTPSIDDTTTDSMTSHEPDSGSSSELCNGRSTRGLRIKNHDEGLEGVVNMFDAKDALEQRKAGDILEGHMEKILGEATRVSVHGAERKVEVRNTIEDARSMKTPSSGRFGFVGSGVEDMLEGGREDGGRWRKKVGLWWRRVQKRFCVFVKSQDRI